MALQWNPVLNDLIMLLARLYPDPDKTRFAVRRAGLDPEEIDFAGTPKVFWMRVTEEANRRDAIQGLINVAKDDFPNVNFDALEQQLRQPAAAHAPKLDDDAWKASITAVSSLERVTGAQPTFLPISFLEVGVLRAKSVARVENPSALGTGFLIRNNLLITNHHVISTPEDARKSKIWFNYQKTALGTDAKVAEFTLDPDATFATSPLNGGDDWTAVRIKGDANAQWGQLDLADISVGINDFVNIIQHPSGLSKQIAIYHNIVAFVGDRRVQYLTDTMPGSSGSPVFDSEWRIVALHHSGGWLPEPGTKNIFFRNEGIYIQALMEGLKEHGLLSS